MGIFISHSGLSSQLGAWGVSVFFILSGFLSAYNSNNRQLPFGIKDTLKYSIKKISKLYPLHIIMMLEAIPYEIWRADSLGNRGNIGLWLIKIISSISLTQSWIPTWTVFGAFNGVAWFLSALLFIYFCFPALQRKIRNRSRSELIILMLFIYGIMILFTWSTRNLILIGTYPDNCYWTAYTFPVLRLGDFSVGCCAGQLFNRKMDNKQIKTSTFYSLLEILVFFLIGFSMWCYSAQVNVLGQNWFRYTCLWLPTSIMIVWLFAVNKGLISKLLTNRVMIWIGNISSITFLTHYMVIFYFRYLFNSPINSIFVNIGLTNIDILFQIIKCVLSLGLTIIVSVLWKKLSNKIQANLRGLFR